MKFFIKAVIILLIPAASLAQDTVKLKHQAQAVADALVKGDYATVVDHTYPKIVTQMGGKEKMMATIKQGMEQMNAQGFSFADAAVGSPGKFYKAGTEIHCLIPQRIALKSPNSRIVNNSYLLAVTKDGGKFWYFIDINRGTYNKIPQLFPNFNKKLVIPEPTQPSME
ncbi:hypothetical protein [Mucilaginibacter ginsenosidivorans]|uniref:DUF4440 domain-containing protein n=1 Tax=Mucilaginibacter ginsenosidivorans TaxID=398053 RepID=A0A5B8UWY3_9SPHI|nr:hypothetical protein [Mucilaginibacter ginsenosidivorans]QEC63630.1 hypothetical protein FRZ54_13935 [Mucilaginibacter ginsenosidivorans]